VARIEFFNVKRSVVPSTEYTLFSSTLFDPSATCAAAGPSVGPDALADALAVALGSALGAGESLVMVGFSE